MIGPNYRFLKSTEVLGLIDRGRLPLSVLNCLEDEKEYTHLAEMIGHKSVHCVRPRTRHEEIAAATNDSVVIATRITERCADCPIPADQLPENEKARARDYWKLEKTRWAVRDRGF